MFSVANNNLKILRKRVNYRRTNAVKSARNLVSAVAELTAGMENCVHNLNRRDTHFRVNTYGDTASVVGYADNVSL